MSVSVSVCMHVVGGACVYVRTGRQPACFCVESIVHSFCGQSEHTPSSGRLGNEYHTSQSRTSTRETLQTRREDCLLTPWCIGSALLKMGMSYNFRIMRT